MLVKQIFYQLDSMRGFGGHTPEGREALGLIWHASTVNARSPDGP
ncbi:MAG: hypothetical protein ACREA0_01780 [bacterium]